MPLTWRQCAYYVREVQELVWSLMRRLDELDAASTGWIEHDAAVDGQLDAHGSVQRAIWNVRSLGIVNLMRRQTQ
jgi:hypothetical protein